MQKQKESGDDCIPQESYHVFCGMTDVMDSRCNILFTFISIATEELENRNNFQSAIVICYYDQENVAL